MTTIRPVLLTDLPLIRSWMRETPEAPAWSESDVMRLAEATASLELRVRKGWMAVDEDSGPAGFIVSTVLRIFPESVSDCEIEFVMTSPAHRRQGVARALVETALHWAAELGAEDVRLEVRASNESAQRLYESCGFERAGLRPGYYAAPTEDAVLMRRRIDSGHAA